MFDKYYLNFILILFCFLILFGCAKTIKQELGPLDSMVGQTYYNCKITKIKRIDNDTSLYCIYEGDEVVIDIYSDLQTEEQIRDEFIEILESNEYDNYSIYY